MEIIKDYIDSGHGFDWGRTSEDYAKFRDIYPPVFYQKLLELGLCTKGQTVLDIGTGTGVLPRNMYKHGAGFTGADISENQIKQAKRLSREAGMDISFIVSSAEEIQFPDGCFDVVTACQCYVYFDKNVIFPKIHKMLKENGFFCILYMAWLIEDSEIAAKSEDLVLKYNPSWSDGRLKRFTYDLPQEAKGLFSVADSFTYDLPVKFTRESWHGRIRACRAIGASSLSQREIHEFEREHLEYLKSVPEVFEIEHFATVFNLRRI
jgi:SAM-dependent methyltransferase